MYVRLAEAEELPRLIAESRIRHALAMVLYERRFAAPGSAPAALGWGWGWE